jgi:hypothetical protein
VTAETISLRLDGEEIAAPAFHQRVGAFLELLREIDRGLVAELDGAERSATSVAWVVESVRSGSPVVVTLRAASTRPPLDLAARVITAVTRGLAALSAPVPLDRPPPYFSVSALESVHTLARASQDGVRLVTVAGAGERVTLSEWADANAQRFSRPVFAHYGSVEGILQMVSVAGGAHFHVRDRLSGRAIRCTVPQDKLDEVVRAFNRRVTVSGRVQTNERGDVLRIHTEELRPFPDQEALPGVEQVAGAFDLTGGKGLDEHLAGLRDAS